MGYSVIRQGGSGGGGGGGSTLAPSTFTYATFAAAKGSGASWTDGDIVLCQDGGIYRYWDLVVENSGLLPAFPYGLENGIVTAVKRRITGFTGDQDPRVDVDPPWTDTDSVDTWTMTNPSAGRFRMTADSGAGSAKLTPPEAAVITADDTHVVYSMDSPYWEAGAGTYADMSALIAARKGGGGYTVPYSGKSGPFNSTNFMYRSTTSATNTGITVPLSEGASFWWALADSLFHLSNSDGDSFTATNPNEKLANDVETTVGAFGCNLRAGITSYTGFLDLGGFGQYSVEINGPTAQTHVYSSIEEARASGDTWVDGDAVLLHLGGVYRYFDAVDQCSGLVPAYPYGTDRGLLTAVLKRASVLGSEHPVDDAGWSDNSVAVSTITSTSSRFKLTGTDSAGYARIDAPVNLTSSDTKMMTIVDAWAYGDESTGNFNIIYAAAYKDGSSSVRPYWGLWTNEGTQELTYLNTGGTRVDLNTFNDYVPGQCMWAAVDGPNTLLAVTLSDFAIPEAETDPYVYAVDPTTTEVCQMRGGTGGYTGYSSCAGIGSYRITVAT